MVIFILFWLIVFIGILWVYIDKYNCREMTLLYCESYGLPYKVATSDEFLEAFLKVPWKAEYKWKYSFFYPDFI